jgi:chromosome segregation ATPase
MGKMRDRLAEQAAEASIMEAAFEEAQMKVAAQNVEIAALKEDIEKLKEEANPRPKAPENGRGKAVVNAH